MKMIFIVAVLLTSISAFSQTVNVKLAKNITDAVNALLGDTVNEGEMSAYVSKVNGKPAIKCTLAPYREAGKGLAKCDISFDVESAYNGITETCSNECFLIHVYDLKTLKITDRVESLSQSCIENLSSGCD